MTTRHVMRTAVSTQIKMTMFFRVGRYVMSDETWDPTAASVALFVSPPPLLKAVDGEVELSCVAGEARVCGSPPTRQRATTIIHAKAGLNVTMVPKFHNSSRTRLH